MVKTNYYVGGKCVWVQESPAELDNYEIKNGIRTVKSYKLGDVEAITDTTGRMITFNN